MNIQRVESNRKIIIQAGHKLPFRDKEIIISQGYNGPYDHFATRRKPNLQLLMDDTYSVDFVLPLGTEVLASKPGKVYGFINFFDEYYEGKDLETGLRYFTNLIILVNEDSTYTIYSHLAKNSVIVTENEKVEQGQPMARTGKSGWIGSRSHLHFEVYKPMQGDSGRLSHPVRFEDYNGPLDHSELEKICTTRPTI